MMTPEHHPRRETIAEVQRMLAHARPDQLRRLMADIAASEIQGEADDMRQRRSA